MYLINPEKKLGNSNCITLYYSECHKNCRFVVEICLRVNRYALVS